jgi:hypothetical protein
MALKPPPGQEAVSSEAGAAGTLLCLGLLVCVQYRLTSAQVMLTLYPDGLQGCFHHRLSRCYRDQGGAFLLSGGVSMDVKPPVG